ncbi:MAG: class I adenylate-forming enzyme family protein [bacterium]|nr:class I adenylate-forming enzyme family protein [bacterium]
MADKEFYQVIERHAVEHPDQVLITIDQQSITYKEFITNTKRIASSMYAWGVRKDTKVGIVLYNSVRWYELFFSAVYLGAQPVPIDPQSGILELEHLFSYTGISYCFFAKEYRSNQILEIVRKLNPEIREQSMFILAAGEEEERPSYIYSFEQFLEKKIIKELLEQQYAVVDEKRVMSLACTSGSTGNPKILTVPYMGFFEAIKDMGDYLEFQPDDTMMIGMPLYHQGGFGMGLQMVVKGGSVIYQPQFDPTMFLKTVEERKVTVIQLTATLAKILLSHPEFDHYDLSSVRICYFAGEVLPADIAKVFVETLHIRVVNIIGSSETATMVVWDSEYDYEVDPSDFRELPFTKAALVDETGKESEIGELKIYTSAIIFNYFGNEQATKDTVLIEDGRRYFLTGDMAKRLPDGRLRFLGRSKRIIKRGANLVHAEEVESALLLHPRVQAVAIIPKKHEVFGEQIVAYVQTADGETITRGEVARYLKGKISAYKIPDKVLVSEEIPHDIGKVQFKYMKGGKR